MKFAQYAEMDTNKNFEEISMKNKNFLRTKKAKKKCLNFKNWNSTDDYLLKVLFRNYGNKWKIISKYFPTRTPYQLSYRLKTLQGFKKGRTVYNGKEVFKQQENSQENSLKNSGNSQQEEDNNIRQNFQAGPLESLKENISENLNLNSIEISMENSEKNASCNALENSENFLDFKNNDKYLISQISQQSENLKNSSEIFEQMNSLNSLNPEVFSQLEKKFNQKTENLSIVENSFFEKLHYFDCAEKFLNTNNILTEKYYKELSQIFNVNKFIENLGLFIEDVKFLNSRFIENDKNQHFQKLLNSSIKSFNTIEEKNKKN